MGVLKLGAVNLDAGMRVAEQSLGHGFDHTGLARSRRPQKQQVAHRPTWGVEPGEKHLVDFDHLFDGLLLADNAAAEGGFKLPRIVTAAVGIEYSGQIRSHKVASRFTQDLSLSRAVFS